jgi:CO/xanthine dehydrogenase FAD-binding subunit
MVKSLNFDTYLIPTIKDIRQIDPIFVENPDKYGPFGAKSLGEPTLELTAAAVNNALKDFVVKQYQRQIQSDEILVAVTIPKWPQKTYYVSYFKLGRRNAMNITRMSISAMLALDEQSNVAECYLVDGSLFSRPQRLTPVETMLIGAPLSDEIIAATREPLTEMIQAAIGTRWSSEYKMPVFINLCQDALRDIQRQIRHKELL